jgi:hypothetical protein
MSWKTILGLAAIAVVAYWFLLAERIEIARWYLG